MGCCIGVWYGCVYMCMECVHVYGVCGTWYGHEFQVWGACDYMTLHWVNRSSLGAMMECPFWYST